MRRTIGFGIISTLLPALLFGAEPASLDRNAATEFFEKKIRPLLVQRCDECHSADKADDSGHLALDNRASLLAGGTRGVAIVAGKPDDSLLIKAVRYGDPNLQMPPDGKLPDAEVELLTKWIHDGAFVPDYGMIPVRKWKSIDWSSARQFWSFAPARRPQIPTTIGELRNPVDAFIVSMLESKNLSSNPNADRRTLIRRLSFDLRGLPPTFDEVAEFTSDDRPDAYDRLVDRLLASPQFGERWSRYWLDLARYVDATPDWQKNTDRAWMYRDWVVQAINEDRPYDEFVRMQLAADLIPDVDPKNLAALGYLGVSPTYWKELKLAPSVIEVIVADEWDERLDTVSRTFLGLTVACARCHDHKFDPVTSRDYYALAGVFASTQVADRPLMPLAQGEQIANARMELDKLQVALNKQTDKRTDDAKKLQQQINEIRAAIPQIDVPLVPVVEDASVYVVADGPDATKLQFKQRQPRDLPVFRRGNPNNPGDMIPRRFLELFTPGLEIDQPADAAQAAVAAVSFPKGIFQQGSGRLELANAILNDATSLSARVIINRIWSHHFGRGLVRTVGDFGQQGERPTHPELLDWLVCELISTPTAHQEPNQNAWSLKQLHRKLVTSDTYRQSSHLRNESATDAENFWLSRMNRRRLEIEPWRDAMLAVAGTLDDRLYGPGLDLDQPAHFRRTLYSRVGRDEQSDMLRVYDFPPPTTHSPARDVTTTPLQQLFVLNSDFVERQSAALATRIAQTDDSVRQKIGECHQLLFQRQPTNIEYELGERFLTASESNESTSEIERLQSYVQALFGLNEFLFVD